MEKKSIFIILCLSCMIVISAAHVNLHYEYVELQQHYEWALEFSKMSPSEREEIAERIHAQIVV